MYIAGRTRTASSPSRMRMASAPYSSGAPVSFLDWVSLISSFVSLRRSGNAHPAFPDLEDPPQRAQALRPALVRARHQGLAPPRDLLAQRPRPSLVQLRVEVVEQRHGGAPRLFAVHPQHGERQCQQQAAGLARGGRLCGVAPVEQQRHPVSLRAGQAAPAGALVRPQLRQLVLQLAAGLDLARRPRRGPHLVALARGPKALRQRARQALGIQPAPVPQACAALDEALRPDVQVRGTALERGVALGEQALEPAQFRAVRRPQGGRLAVEELSAIAHGAAHDAQPVCRIYDNLEPPAVLAGRDVAAVDPEHPLLRPPLHLQLRAPGALAVTPAGEERARAVADHARRVLRAEGAPAGEDTDGLQQRGLALGVAAVEHVEPGVELERGLADVAEVTDGKLLDPGQAHLRNAWA